MIDPFFIWRQEIVHRKLHAGSVGKLADLLGNAFPVSGCSDQGRRFAVLQGSGKDLGRAGAFLMVRSTIGMSIRVVLGEIGLTILPAFNG